MYNNNNINFFIGYDSKEDIAYRVCKSSLISNSSINLKVNSLKLDELVTKKFYRRDKDPLPSTEFTYSRFLVPALMLTLYYNYLCIELYKFKKDKFDSKKAKTIFRYSILYLFLIFVIFLLDKIL